MKKFISLLKANMSEGMNLFKVSTKKQNNFTKKFIPIILAIFVMIVIYFYAERLMSVLQPVNMEYVMLTIFVVLTSFLTIIEGIYKSGNLLFKCKDDNLLFSLPIKKSTVLAIRIFKFYLFELAYNSIFLIPAMICYAKSVSPNITFYLVSIIGLFVFPIIPILVSCLIGTIITFIASKFKGKNMVQTGLTFILLIGVLYISYNSENILTNIANNASSINDIITKVYYPAGVYNDLILNFNALKLLEFIGIHLALLIVTIILIGKSYFNINSNVNAVKTKKSNKDYIVKTSNPIWSIIKKELNRFINSPVFFTNAGLGVILYIVGCVLLVVKFDMIENIITQMDLSITLEEAKNYITLIIFALVCFTSCLTSITSSMISLEGKAFNILKTLPIKPYTIVKSKILAALLIMLPFMIIGDIIVFIKFKFDIVSMILILISSVLLPLVTETIGIMVNLKYPRMDAKNDTEVVKQSMSSLISVLIGMFLLGITAFVIYKAATSNIQTNIIILSIIVVYAIMYAILSAILHKTADKSFNNISI